MVDSRGVDAARAVKPSIPLVGEHGIELHDELNPELRLRCQHTEPPVTSNTATLWDYVGDASGGWEVERVCQGHRPAR